MTTTDTPDPRNHIADHGPWQDDSDLDAALRLAGDFAMDDAEQARVHRRPVGQHIQSGPCLICGSTNYPLSFGGPQCCPSCDCGATPGQYELTRKMERIYAQDKELAALRAELAAAKAEHEWVKSINAALFPYQERAVKAASALAQATDTVARMRAALERSVVRVIDGDKCWCAHYPWRRDFGWTHTATCLEYRAALAADAPESQGAGDEVAG